MLAVTSYPKTYVDACRADIKKQLAAFRAIPETPQRAAFETDYSRMLVLALDHLFLHRMRGAEGKDGNPLNELRMLCNGIKESGGVLAKDNGIKYDAAKSVTGTAVDAPIKLDADTIEKLADAVFAEIGKRFA